MNFRILLLFSIISLSLGSYFISNSFAVDFTDSTGYSASWAKGSGYQTVLLKCNEFSVDSRDGNWCNEWVAYVLDQGFENFPQSTSESNENISQKQTITSDDKFNELRSFFSGFNDPQITFQSEKTIDGVPGYTKAQLLRTYMNGEMVQKVLVAETEQPTGEQQFFKNIISSLRNEHKNNPNKELVSWNSDNTDCSGYVADESNCVIQSDLLGYYDTIGDTYSNGEFVDPKASCFVTTTVKISSEYTKSIWCIKGNYYVSEFTVWDKYIGVQDISLLSHVIESIDTKYGYPILSPQDFLENPDVDQVFLSSNDDGLKTPKETTVEVPKIKPEEKPKTQQDCIDSADNLLGTATHSTVTDIIDNAFDDYLLCMENIGRPLGPVDPMYGFTLSQADKIQGIQDDCEYFAITKNTNNQEKTQNELQKCRMQYIEIAREAMKENRAKSVLQSEVMTQETSIVKNVGSHLSDGVISDEKSCIAIIEGATWNPTFNSCDAKFLSIEPGETLTISKHTKLCACGDGPFKNRGTINVLGELMNFDTLENFGTINVLLSIVNEGNFINKGTITIDNDGGIYIFSTGTLENFGTIVNNNLLVNFGEITNNCEGVISGNPIGNDFGTGDNPINNVSCVVSEKVTLSPEVPSSSKPEVPSSSKPEVTSQSESKGGCLIATATYGSELAPQVQQLRELRDNSLLQTESGSSFMKSFNSFYYSFSPTIADFERENPLFKEAVKIAITPMLSTLSIMTLAEDGSESQVLGLGISVILLNLGIYVVGPVFGISKLKSHIQRKQIH